MENFEYKVSVIVPVYNVENYIRDCLNSLINQTIPKSDIEVLIINDGSTDNSLEICEEYARLFPFFKVFSKENEGLSATRNYGIKRAKGKYLMYIDSDDMYTSDTVKAVTDFFDTVYDEVDVVCYKDQPYNNGKKMPLHFRYNYLKKSGVYDLNMFPYILQTRVSVAVKNLFEDNILFYEKEKVSHEDLIYNNENVKRKMKIGFCNQGEYMYNRSNESSIMHTSFVPMYLFNGCLDYYEKLFDQYSDGVPKYYQAMYFHDISWKIKENILMPYHLQGREYESAVKRLKLLLDRVDDEIILTCPSTDNFHRHFFMNWKHDKVDCTVVAKNGLVCVEKQGREIFKQQKFEICLYKLQIENKCLRMIAFVKSALFNYMEKPKVYVVIKNAQGQSIKYNLELKLSSESYYHTKVQTNNFWQFVFEYYIDEIQSYWIEVEIDGVAYPTYYWFAPTCPYANEIKNYNAIYGKYTIDFVKNIFYIKKHSIEEMTLLRENKTSRYMGTDGSVYSVRYAADNMVNKEIWLYYDCLGVNKDNGWFQFVNDYGKDDDIERYYVNANDRTPEMEKYAKSIIKFGSFEHKILYVAAKKIITAYVETENICPFKKTERVFFADIAHAQVIYLQHGILHAHLPWKYSPARIEADKVVVSSNFEIDNLVNIYKFKKEDLIPVGMARFEMMNRTKRPIRRILFAPSWRNYLIGPRNGNQWIYMDEKFVKSDYFTNFNEFLNDPRLENVLANNNVYLDVKLHPIFVPYKKYFDHINPHVSFVGDEVVDDEYSMYITDFSSYVFNFAYMNRYILYYVPDWIQFISGMNQYRELDLPFEKAFGPLVKEGKAAICEIEEAINSDFTPKKIYKERMSKFFLPMENNREKLYEYMTKRDDVKLEGSK